MAGTQVDAEEAPAGGAAVPLEAAFAHCAAETRREAKNFYYAFLLLPAERRRAMYALYTFCRVADDIVDEPGAVEHKRAALERLRRDLDACVEGRPRGPMLTALADVIRAYGVAPEHLVHVIDGCAMDLETARYESFEELSLYLDRVASAVGRATMQVFGIDPAAREAYAVAGGQSVQLTNIIRDVREDLERDRVYLPQDELARFGVTEDDLRAGRLTDGVRALLAFQVDRARGLYHRAREATTAADKRALLPLTAISRLYERVLDRIESRRYDVFTERVALPGWRKALIGVGTWLRARAHLPIGR